MAIVAAALLVVAAGVIYTRGLAQSPPYLMHDELQFSLQARSIAETGHDLAGRTLPVFFTEPEFPAGRDPVLIYFTAAVLQVLPFTQESVKSAVVLIGLLNVALMVLAGWKLTGHLWFGVLAGALLALTPIHFIRARMVLSPFASIPFVLGWLLALAIYLRSGSRRALLAACAAAALSMYSYLACVVMAPIYIAVALWIGVRREGKAVAVPVALVVAAVLVPMAIWYVTHPERYAQVVEAYRLYGHGTPTVAAPVLAPGTPTGPQRWLALGWQFLSPDFLFLSGDSSLVNSTRTAGLFPLAFAALMLAGVWRALVTTDDAQRVAVIGLLTAPLASVLSGAVEMNRIMFVIPFGAVMAAYGAWHWLQRGGGWRIASVLLLLSIPVQFAGFYRDYRESYPSQASKWFGGNVRDAVREVAAGTGPVYFSTHIPFANRYWSFYAPATERGRQLLAFESAPADAPTGARAACAVGDAGCLALAHAPGWTQVAVVREPSGEESFHIYARQ